MSTRTKPAAAEWRNRIVGFEQIDPTSLAENPDNYRIHSSHQQAALRGTIDEIGYLDPITVQAGPRRLIIDGHLRVAEAIRRGMPTIPANIVDLDDDEAALALASIDPIAAMADHNRQQLARLLERVKSEHTDVTDFLRRLREAEGIPDPTGAKAATGAEDAVPPYPKHPVTTTGELWRLGEHRLVIGDATDPRTHLQLMNGKRADIMVTDPPYGVDYVGKTKEQLTISNDGRDQSGTAQLVRDALRATNLRAGAPWYIHAASMTEPAFRAGITAAGFTLRQTLVWIKQQFVMSHQDYHWRHEMILYGWIDGAPHWFLADRTIDTIIDDRKPIEDMTKSELLEHAKALEAAIPQTIIEEARPRQSRMHPTTKPVNLEVRLIRNSSRAGAALLDPFAGSGSTLIAGEQLGRPTYAIEIDPGYADVIIERWQAYTGGAAAKVA